MRKSETLARIPLFRSLPKEAVEKLDTQCIWRRAKGKECILDYKDDGADLYFVAQGHVRVRIQAISGREAVLRDIGDGGYFGELAAIDGLPRSASIIAVTDSIIAKMSPTIFRDVVHNYPDLCDQLLTALAAQIRMLANRVSEFRLFDARTRLYAELLRLSRPTTAGDAEAVISPPPTHFELAARVSWSREAVTRELSRLVQEGLLARAAAARWCCPIRPASHVWWRKRPDSGREVARLS